MGAGNDDPITERAKARIGMVLRNKWRIDHLIGVGGMAAVYAGTHRNGKRGAIKLLHLELSIDEDAKRRFLQEGYAANRVDHPGVVSVLDDDVAEDGSIFVVMELLEGRSVEALAEAQPDRRLDLSTALNVADQVLDVLAAAHDKGIIHRDIKPENLFLTSAGAIKLLDFGIARLHEHQSGASATRTGSAMGTPAFMAPEQALGNWSEVDGRTDLWALAASLYTLLTGRLVHEAVNVQQIMLAAMTKQAQPIRAIAPEIPEPVANVIDRALAFERGARFSDARAMARALREAGAGISGFPARSIVSIAPPMGAYRVAGVSTPSLLGATITANPKPKSRARALLGAGALASIAVLGITLLLLRPWSKPALSAQSAGARGLQETPAASAPLVTAGVTADVTSAPIPSAPVTSASAVSPPAASAAHPPSKGTSKTGAQPAPKPTSTNDPFGQWK